VKRYHASLPSTRQGFDSLTVYFLFSHAVFFSCSVHHAQYLGVLGGRQCGKPASGVMHHGDGRVRLTDKLSMIAGSILRCREGVTKVGQGESCPCNPACTALTMGHSAKSVILTCPIHRGAPYSHSSPVAVHESSRTWAGTPGAPATHVTHVTPVHLYLEHLSPGNSPMHPKHIMKRPWVHDTSARKKLAQHPLHRGHIPVAPPCVRLTSRRAPSSVQQPRPTLHAGRIPITQTSTQSFQMTMIENAPSGGITSTGPCPKPDLNPLAPPAAAPSPRQEDMKGSWAPEVHPDDPRFTIHNSRFPLST
jgi:hypothetical protein